VIQDPLWRDVELSLRRTLYKWRHFPVDMVLDPFICVPKALKHTFYGLSVQHETIGAEDSTAKAYHYFNQLETMEDVEKIKDYHIVHDTDETVRRMDEAEALFGDMAPAMATGHSFHLGVWDYLSQVMGVENVYYALADQPELLRALMERVTAATLCAIDDADACGGHDDNANLCHCSHIYTDELLPDSGQGRGPTAKNCWAMGLAQLFTSVSPAVFEEFELPYIMKMAERFGMIYYGCCDRLDDRLDLVKRIPNVRKVSCSPWSDRESFAAKIGTELVMSNKPSPAYLAVASFDEAAVQDDLKLTCELARNHRVNLEFILKDISTVNHEPERLARWADTAMRVVHSI